MADNTTLNSGAGGDTIRDIDRSGVKTQVVTLDLGGSGTESLISGVIPTATTEYSAKNKPVQLDEDLNVTVYDHAVIQELQEIKAIMSDLLFLLQMTVGK